MELEEMLLRAAQEEDRLSGNGLTVRKSVQSGYDDALIQLMRRHLEHALRHRYGKEMGLDPEDNPLNW